ncbi:AraC family transcriptional regulator [Deferribacteres bacterium DY0037]|nr:helix-turn-helix transcriptional regulator [Denitrovibrio acetiphilus]
MNSENMTKLSPVKTGFIIDPMLPVIPFAMEVTDAGCAASHAHPRGQVIYAGSGIMRVVCGSDMWVVPSSQAVWVPPYAEHEVFFPGKVILRNLFIDPSVTENLPETCTVFEVSPLLRELSEKAAVAESYSPDSSYYRLMLVIIDELADMKETDVRLPLAGDQRLLHVLNELLKNPGDSRGLDHWAVGAGASSRTLSRLFKKETGFTFYEWRKRLRLQEAIKRLEAGDDVTSIAFDLGYQSLSAFIKMFRESLGLPPAKFSRQSK